MSDLTFASLRAFLEAERPGLIAAIWADIQARTDASPLVMTEEQRRGRVETSVDIFLGVILGPSTGMIEQSAPGMLKARFEQGLTLEQTLRGAAIIRTHVLRTIREAVAAGVPGAWEGMERALEAGDVMTTSIAAVYNERLEAVRQALTEAESRYRSLYEGTPVMMHSIDAKGVLLSVSDLWLDTLGYTREEVIGRRSSEFLTEASRRDAVENILPAFFRTGACRNVPYQFIKKNGETCEVLLSAILERGPDGAPLRSLAVLVDMTEQRRMEGLIEAQSADLRALSTPLIPVSDRVVVMSLVGALDDGRVRQILEMLLAGVSAHRAAFAIVDVTGVSRADSAVADALRRAAGAVRLLGAQVVVTGIQPSIAQELVGVAVELGGIVTRGTLKDGVAYALGGGRRRRGG